MRQENTSTEGKGQEEKAADTAKGTKKSRDDRDEVKQTICQSTQVHQRLYHPLPFAAEMHSSHQVHKSPREAWHLHSSVTSFTIHCSSIGGT